MFLRKQNILVTFTCRYNLILQLPINPIQSMRIKIKYSSLFLIIQLSILLLSCDKEKEIIEPKLPAVSDSFESGSIGIINELSITEWELYIADDNDNPNIPDSWRSWWYIKMENLLTSEPTIITIKNSGWQYYYLPVYSYDQKVWHRFNEDEVVMNQDHELVITNQFQQGNVWIAMFYPYTFSDLENYINQIKGNPYLKVEIPGYTQEGKPVYVFRITDPNVPVSAKKRVFMHARTHPAETPPSFLIEGMINYLLSGTGEAAEILSGIEFYIFPMQNVDGVIAGNYRSTPKSENLEIMWYFDNTNPLDLSKDVPPEISIIHQYAKELMNDGGPPVSIALNLHSSNSEPDIRPFFFPHFGSESQGYSAVEASLWTQQLNFISYLAYHHGYNMIEPVIQEGGSSFAGKKYPESWWWANYQDQVMAMTMEMTYGRAGYSPRWVEPDDMRLLGESLILGIRDYYSAPAMNRQINVQLNTDYYLKTMQYPELYPALDEDESKR